VKETSYQLIGLHYDLGASRVGAALGPKMLRELGVATRLRNLGRTVLDGRDHIAPSWPALPPPSADLSSSQSRSIKHLSQATPYLRSVYQEVLGCYRAGHQPIILGGDHSASIGTIAAAVTALREIHGPEAELGLLWVDAHPDLNTPATSPSMNLHGLPLATLLGFGEPSLTNLGGYSPKLRPENVALVGIREVDPGEREFIKTHHVTTYTMKEIDQLGMGTVIQQALSKVTARTAGLFLSYDLDVSDPNLAPGVGSPVRGGITLRESHLVMELVAESGKLFGGEVVELNPLLDAGNTTAELAISLLESMLGKTIL
jgi:arginase